MKNIFAFLISLTLLTSCTNTKKAMNSWLGNTRQNLILSWGPPAKTASDGGTGEILIYARQVYIPQYGMNYYDYKMFYVDAQGKIYHWLMQRQQVPPTQIDLNIYKRY